LDNHHHGISLSINTYGGEYPSISDDIFSSSQGLDLQGINSKFVVHILRSTFMNWDASLIQNDHEYCLINTSLGDKSDVVNCQVF